MARSFVPSRLSRSRPADERPVEVLRPVETLLLGHGEQQLEQAVHFPRPRRPPAPPRRRSRCRRRASSRRRRPSLREDDVDLARREGRTGCPGPLAHHVEMRLQNDRRRGVTPSRRRHAYDDVALLVDLCLEPVPVRPAENVVANSASSFGGRAIRVSSANRTHTPAGSRPSKTLISAGPTLRRRTRGRDPPIAASSPQCARLRTSRCDR